MAYGTQPFRAGLTLLRAYGAEGGMEAEVRRGSGEKSLTPGRGELQGAAIGLETRRGEPTCQGGIWGTRCRYPKTQVHTPNLGHPA